MVHDEPDHDLPPASRYADPCTAQRTLRCTATPTPAVHGSIRTLGGVSVAGKALLNQGKTRRRNILRFIATFRKEHPYGPTISEIAEAVELGSANATRHHLLKLRDEGKIVMESRVARSIDIAKPVKPLSLAEVTALQWPKNARFIPTGLPMKKGKAA